MVTLTGPRVPCTEAAISRTLLLGWVLVQVARVSGTTGVVVAYNLTWKSTNFKTILEWEPKPINNVYTVQISHRLGNWKSKCYSTTDTECDLTDEIVKDVKQTYSARVLSKLANATSYAGEPVYKNSPEFTPYLETNLGRPTIQSFEQVGTKLNVTVQDARTLVRMNGTFLTLRDVFGKDLSYTLYYWKASSTGKKTAKTNTNEFLIDVDKGENYCFNVQAVIPSRKANQKSPESSIECTSREKGVFKGHHTHNPHIHLPKANSSSAASVFVHIPVSAFQISSISAEMRPLRTIANATSTRKPSYCPSQLSSLFT